MSKKEIFFLMDRIADRRRALSEAYSGKSSRGRKKPPLDMTEEKNLDLIAAKYGNVVEE